MGSSLIHCYNGCWQRHSGRSAVGSWRPSPGQNKIWPNNQTMLVHNNRVWMERNKKGRRTRRRLAARVTATYTHQLAKTWRIHNQVGWSGNNNTQCIMWCSSATKNCDTMLPHIVSNRLSTLWNARGGGGEDMRRSNTLLDDALEN